MTDELAAIEARDADIRNVKMHRDIWDPAGPLGGISIRDEAGRAITIDWGKPDAEGFWSPMFTVASETEADRLLAALHAEQEARARVEADYDHLVEVARDLVWRLWQQPSYGWVTESQAARAQGRPNREARRMERISAAERRLRALVAPALIDPATPEPEA